MNKDEEIKMLKEQIFNMKEKQFTNKEMQLKKIAELFGEKAFEEASYEFDGKTKTYQRLTSFYDSMGRMGKDSLFELKDKIKKFAESESNVK